MAETTKKEVEEFCSLFKAIMAAYPGMRLCQGVFNSVTYMTDLQDMFHVKNEDALKRMKDYVK